MLSNCNAPAVVGGAGREDEGDDSFRINNDHAARLARRVMERCPDLVGFFELRELGSRR